MTYRTILDDNGDVIGVEEVTPEERITAIEAQNAELLAALSTATTIAQVRDAATAATEP